MSAGGIIDPFGGCESHPRCSAADTASESPLSAVIYPLRPAAAQRRAVEFSCSKPCREPRNDLNALLSVSAPALSPGGKRTGAVSMTQQQMRRREREKTPEFTGWRVRILERVQSYAPSCAITMQRRGWSPGHFWTPSPHKTHSAAATCQRGGSCGLFATVCLMSPAGRAPTAVSECVRERERESKGGGRGGVCFVVFVRRRHGRKRKYQGGSQLRRLGAKGSVSAAEVRRDK